MAFKSVGRLMGGGKRSRRKGSRLKKTRKGKRKAVTVKVKIKGSLKQVQHAAKELGEGADDDNSSPPIGAWTKKQT
jgi:hypothetical protein